MKARLQRFLRTRAALPAACYLAAALLWLAWGGWRLLADSGLQSWETPAADFELADLAPEGDGLVTTSQDPQMVLPDVRGQNIRTVSYTVTFGGGAPREMCLYYSPHRDEPFSQDRRVFPRQTADGTYVFTLPRGRVAKLRLDPCSPDRDRPVTMAFAGGVIRFNAPETLPHGADYFLPDGCALFCLLLYPGLAAAALDWLRAACKALRGASAAE